MKKHEEKDQIAHCRKKLQNIRACIYILILIFIVRIAMMDFNGLSPRLMIDLGIMLLLTVIALFVENGLRRKLKKEEDHAEEERSDPS